MFLRQSTASQEILLGRFLDSTDGDSEETGLAIANTDIKLWKHGATTLVDKNSGGATHIANGNYYAVLDATDTDTIGNLEVHVHVAGALAVKREYTVLAAAVYDVLFGTAAPSTLDAAAIRTALGMSSADLDTRLDAIWTTALTEAYRSTGSTGTAAQLLYEILQNITEFSISSTTKTVKKLDGSTTAKTYTLDSATAPTSITEAT